MNCLIKELKMYFIYKYSWTFDDWIIVNCAVSAQKALEAMILVRRRYNQKCKITREVIVK